MKNKNRQNGIPILALGLAACSDGASSRPPAVVSAVPTPMPMQGGGDGRGQKPQDEKPHALKIMPQPVTFSLPGNLGSVTLEVLEKKGDIWVIEQDEDATIERHIANIAISDDALGENTLSLSDTTYFELRATDDRLIWQLWVRDDVPLDYEAAQTHRAQLSLSTNADLHAVLELRVGDRDDPPSAVRLSETAIELREGTYATARKLADIGFYDVDSDPENQKNSARIDTHELFELRKFGSQLWLKAGSELDYDAAQSHAVEIFAAPTIRQIAVSLVDGLILNRDGQPVVFPSVTFILTVIDDPSDNPVSMELI